MADEGFAEFLSGVIDGNTEGETSIPETTPETVTQTTPEVSSTAPAPAEPDNLRTLLEAKKAAHPDLADTIDAIHRELQGGFTPKLQEAAELRRKLEGLDDGAIEWVRNFRTTAGHSPAAARQMLQDALAEMETYGQPSTPVDPYEELGYQSEVERALAGKVTQLEQYMIQQQAAMHQATADKHFAELATKWGDIPYEQKRAVELARGQANLPSEMIPVLWRGMFGVDAAERIATDKLMATQKQGLPSPPSGLVNRAPVQQLDPSSMSFKDYLKHAIPD